MAQRGILTIEDQIKEAEEQNTRLKNRLNNQANKNIDTSITNFNEVRTNTQIEFKDRTPLYYKLVSIDVISKYKIFLPTELFFLSPRRSPKLLLQTVLTQVDLETRLYEYEKNWRGL